MADAGEVREYLGAEAGAEVVDDFAGAFAAGAAGAVGDGDKRRLQVAERSDGVSKVLDAVVGLGREELK